MLIVSHTVTLVAAISAEAQTIWYVDDDASTNGTGTSWSTAYKCLQDALGAAGLGDQIWVARGTYRPDEDDANTNGTGDRLATFQLVSGVAVYGGFDGTESLLDERAGLYDQTILTGDLLGDDGPAFVNNQENSYHVVTVSGVDSNGILDGFTITGGNANGSGPENLGGGMYSASGSASVADCVFSGNSAEYGGAIMHDASAVTLTNCTLSGNRATDDGGGMYNARGSSPILVGCTFSGNSANDDGGGMVNYECGPPLLANCTFSGNSAVYLGGGIYNLECGGQVLINCTLTGNSASSGGGIANENFSSPMLVNCFFSGNAVSYDGGGMLNYYRSDPTVANCTFSGNAASYDGGGMHNYYKSNAMLTGCTFSGNTANAGSGIHNYNSTPTLANCILWDGGDEVANENNSVATITYSDIQGGWPGDGNIDQDPLFVDSDGLDDIPGTEDDELRLLSGSPCINVGSNGVLLSDGLDLDGDGDMGEPIPIELDGHARILCSTVDMGAYEFGMGDYDCDRAIDLNDFADWSACMTGPSGGPYPPGCEPFDFEFDGDVDLRDFGAFCVVCSP